MYGAFASKLGSGMAKVGKKAAQSEAGRSATRAAVKGATDAAVNDLSERYLGPKSEPVPAPHPSKPPPPQAQKSNHKPTGPKSGPNPTSSSTTSSYHHHHHHRSHCDRDSDEEFEEYMRKSQQQGPPKPSVFKRFKPSINLSKSSDAHPQRSSRPVGRSKDKIYKYALSKEPDWDQTARAVALYNFKSDMKCDLEFCKGQWIEILTRTGDDFDWWEGRIGDRVGIFPANYVRVA